MSTLIHLLPYCQLCHKPLGFLDVFPTQHFAEIYVISDCQHKIIPSPRQQAGFFFCKYRCLPSPIKSFAAAILTLLLVIIVYILYIMKMKVPYLVCSVCHLAQTVNSLRFRFCFPFPFHISTTGAQKLRRYSFWVCPYSCSSAGLLFFYLM